MNDGEKKVVSRMIAIYCRAKHNSKDELCADCEELRQYALQRLDRCVFGEEKPTCVTCPIHCYKSEMRAKIKTVMRYSGPRMLFFHPIDTFRHLIQEKKRNRDYVEKMKKNRKE